MTSVSSSASVNANADLSPVASAEQPSWAVVPPRREPGPDRPLRLGWHRQGEDALVLCAEGALDGVGEVDFAELMRRRLQESARVVVLDLSAVSFMTTAGAVALLEAGVRAAMQDVALVLVPSPAVDRLLGLIEVVDRFTYAPTVAAALTGLDTPGAHRVPRMSDALED